MTLLEAFEAGLPLTIELTGDPLSDLRITRLVVDGGDLLALHDSHDSPWSVRPPPILEDVRGDGPVWTSGSFTIRETDAAAPQSA